MTPRVLTDEYAVHLARAGAAFDRLVAESPGDPVARRAEWTAALDGPLPTHGAGADAVVDQLVDDLVPNGVRLVEPGFWGWITCGATTVPTIAALTASVAGGQRYGVTAFNLARAGVAALARGALRPRPDDAGRLLQRRVDGQPRRPGRRTAERLRAARHRRGRRRHRWCRAAPSTPPRRRTTPCSARPGCWGSVGPTCAWSRPTPAGGCGPTGSAQTVERDLADGVLPVAVVATAGTTNTGAIDPIRALGEIAHELGVWFHVDGAYGLPGILDERVAHLYDGLDLADSAIVDPHKWLNAPIGVAATFVRVRATCSTAPSRRSRRRTSRPCSRASPTTWSTPSTAWDPAYSEFGVELSSPSRGVVVWSILRELGREGVAARIRDDNDLAQQLAEHVRREPSLELLTEPTLSIVCFRYVADGIDDLDAFNDALLKRLQRETPYLPSSTRVDGAYAIRPCFINARTTPDMVDGFAAAAVRLGDELLAAGSGRGEPPFLRRGRASGPRVGAWLTCSSGVASTPPPVTARPTPRPSPPPT